MKKNDLYVSRKILQKSNSYLKIAIGMFLVISIFVVTTGIVYIQQYYGLNKNFFNNKAVHTINVSTYVDEAGIKDLNIQDCDKISKILSSTFPEEQFRLIPVYAICTGIVDDDGDMYKVYGVPEEQFDIVGELDVESATIYFVEHEEVRKKFEISNFEVSNDGGLVSNESITMEFNCRGGVSTTSPILIFNNIQGEMFFQGFVEGDTFLEIAQKVTGVQSEKIDDLCGSGLVELSGIFVDVKELTMVEEFSQVLGEHEYSSMCTFDAFDGFGEYFDETIWMVSAFAVLILCISVFLLVFAFDSYYKMQQKDMGILKYYGFDEKRILNIYINGLRLFFVIDAVVVLIYAFVLAIFLKVLSHWIVIGMFIVMVWTILAMIYMLLKHCVIKKYIQKDVLYLLKKSKEIE